MRAHWTGWQGSARSESLDPGDVGELLATLSSLRGRAAVSFENFPERVVFAWHLFARPVLFCISSICIMSHD